MNPIENQVDWTAAAMPDGERVAAKPSRPRAPVVPQTKRGVMEALLGDNDLAAYDPAGNDPYNATGRQFRR